MPNQNLNRSEPLRELTSEFCILFPLFVGTFEPMTAYGLALATVCLLAALVE